MVEIRTEFGIIFTLDEEVSPFERTCMEYPYTVGLCLESMAIGGNMEAVLAFRGINHSLEESRIREAVSHYYEHKMRLPDVAIAFATAGYAIDDSFPDIGLFLVAAKQEATWDAFYFGTAPIGKAQREKIPIPAWLKKDFHEAWKKNTSNEICVRIHTDRLVLSLHLHGLDVAIREYSPGDLRKAVQSKLTNSLDQKKWGTEKKSKGSRKKRGNEGPSMKL